MVPKTNETIYYTKTDETFQLYSPGLIGSSSSLNSSMIRRNSSSHALFDGAQRSSFSFRFNFGNNFRTILAIVRLLPVPEKDIFLLFSNEMFQTNYLVDREQCVIDRGDLHIYFRLFL